jgi:serine/threonine protein kinase
MLDSGAVLQSRYAIESLIGSGGMGRVYLSRQTMLRGRRLAIKEVAFDAVEPAHRPAAMAAFRTEAETLAGLSHPYLVDVKDCFEERGHLYLVMDYVEGQSLEARVQQQGPLPIAAVLEHARQLCTVLTYLHTQKPPIIFRDLKPANVMVDPSDTVRLVDFGLARAQSDTPCDFLEGTPGYAPIEQMLHLGLPCDARTDLYGLGATLFYLLTGQAPLDARCRLVDDPSQEPRDLRPEVPAWLSSLVARLLALRPEDRLSSALDVRTVLDSNVRERPTFMAPVLPFFEQMAQEQPVRRVDAFVRDMLGRRAGVRILHFEQSRVRFSCARLVIPPKELHFALRGHSQPVAVQIAIVSSKHSADVSHFEVNLLNAPLSVHRVLRDAFEPGRRVERQQPRSSPRAEVSFCVQVLNLEVIAQAEDMSTTGCRLVTLDPLPLGRHLVLGFELDDDARTWVEVAAEVRWSRTRRDGGYESGLIYTDVTPEVEQALHEFLGSAPQEMALGA